MGTQSTWATNYANSNNNTSDNSNTNNTSNNPNTNNTSDNSNTNNTSDNSNTNNTSDDSNTNNCHTNIPNNIRRICSNNCCITNPLKITPRWWLCSILFF